MSKQISNKVEYRSLSELKELEGNPRTITRDKMNKLVDELDEDGCVVKTLSYDVDDFADIAKDHPAPEWQCHDW